ncbi:MAG TPA: hypothetical protein VFO39_20670 [Candidatus Sulfotelmatobacter sp.]|nr:hypothetical protein [Candidatus Sulfotelmatobacter sp.]
MRQLFTYFIDHFLAKLVFNEFGITCTAEQAGIHGFFLLSEQLEEFGAEFFCMNPFHGGIRFRRGGTLSATY